MIKLKMMKKTFILAALLTYALISNAQECKIYVDMGTRGHDVSKSMYGMFFEEINHAGDGGLYAEMLQNRGFEEQVYPSGTTYRDGRVYSPHAQNYYGGWYADFAIDWNIEAKKWTGWTVTSSGCTLSKDVVELDAPLHENTPHALHLAISNATAAANVNVTNSGYWGVATKKGETYKLRFYLKGATAAKVMAQFVTKSGTTFGNIDFNVIADDQWHEYTGVLTATNDMTDGTFRLRLSAFDGRTADYDIDYVSLFPTDTYKGRENGMRKDVAEMLEGLHPNFLRWPGGCIVEGFTLENRVKWKETLGDPMTRRGEFSLWGYRSTYGLGMFEFLQLCEDMGMDGMFVANVGLSCSIRNGDFIEATDAKALQTYRQDIEDAIQYAIGDPMTNEWAAKRAEAGHPEPFPLKYVELGNENGTDRYVKRFDFFYNYLKRKYPQITFINTMSWSDAGQFKKTDMYDVHWYVAPDEFYNFATLFDTAPRGDYTIYAGEYATNNEVGSGNMEAALSEAVFIGNMERNSDFVTMASYAPLLENIHAPNWACNLIHFDNNRIMGRASYYVQQLYSQHRPSYNVKTRLFSNEQTLQTRGRIGVGTWSTKAEFRNVRVTNLDGSKVLYESDFENRPNEWTEGGGTWTMSGNTYKQTADGAPCLTMMNGASFTNSVLELEARKTSGSEGFLICFAGDSTNINTHWRVNIGGWGNTKTGFEKVTDGNSSSMGSSVSTHIQSNRWYKIKLVMEETVGMTLYLDDVKIIELPLSDLENGRVQAFGGYDEETGEMVVKVVNAQQKSTTATIRLNANGIASTGTVTTLSASKLSEENTLEQPRRISPQTTTFEGFSEEFQYTFKPCSFTILRVKVDATAPQALVIPTYEWDDTPIISNEAKIRQVMLTKSLAELVKNAKALVVENSSGADQFNAAIVRAEDLLGKDNATNKELEVMTSRLQTSLDRYVTGLMDTDNELTSNLKNPDFKTMQTSGWQGSTPSLEHNVGEFFNTNFDMYQILTKLKPGKYLVYVQAFYRNGSHDVAYPKHQNGTELLYARFYAGSASTSIRSVYDQTFSMGSWRNYLDNRDQAERAFNTDPKAMANYLVTSVGTNGSLRIGVKKSVSVQYDWTCFNNFRIFYIPQTDDDTAIEQIDSDCQNDAPLYDLSGRQVITPRAKGIYIQNGKKVLMKQAGGIRQKSME